MDILFLGCLFKKNEEHLLLLKSKTGLQSQANAYQWALINGLDNQLKKPISIINVIPVGTYPNYFTDIILKKNKWNHKNNASDLEIGSINLPLIKQIMRAVFCKYAVKDWIKHNNDNELCVLLYSTYLPFLYAIKNLPNNIKIILIVTDLPKYYDLTSSIGVYMRYLRKIYNVFVYSFLKRVDGFVCITQNINEQLNVNNKPYVVIEGIVDPDTAMSYVDNIQQSKVNIVLYTGTLNYKFGIMNLIYGFMSILEPGYELWICGAGEAEDDIKNYSNYDKRIKFWGYVSKSKIYDLQRKSTILINPRANDEDYTKYSFPSKTLEYMLSGRPVLMYKLDGVPDEYDQYLYYIDGKDPKDIADAIIKVCEKSKNELDTFGKMAKNFVLINKNSNIQAKKLIRMINSI